MEVTPKQIIHYETPTGKNLYSLWYEDLRDIKIKDAVDKRLDRVELGLYGDCDSIGGCLFELKFRAFGIRIYFAEIGGVVVLLLCAGDKSSQSKDIKKAKEYWEEYCNRIEEV